MRGVFLFWTLTCCPSLPFFSLSSPRADLSFACPDGLESFSGKTGHPSPPLHLTPPPSPLLLTCPEANLRLHLAPWVRTRETAPQHSALMKHHIKQCAHCWAKVLHETTFFSSWFTATLFQNELMYAFDNPNFCLSRCSHRLATIGQLSRLSCRCVNVLRPCDLAF